MGVLTRRFFAGAGVAMIGLAGASLLTCRATASGQAGLRYDRLDILLPDMVDPTRIGRAFRRQMGQDRLKTLAAHNPHILDALRHDCPTARRQLLRNGIRQDFAARKVVLCDRFVLSETECIVAGLRYDRSAPPGRADV